MLPFRFLLSCRISGYWEKGNPHIGKFQLSLCHSVQEVKYEACDLHRCSERLSVLTQNKEAFQRYRSSWLQQSSLFPLICQMSISSTVQNKLYCIKLNYWIINNSALLTASAMPHWNPSLLTSTFWGSVIRQSIFRSSAPETIRHFSATIQPKAEQLWEILKQSDRSNYHLPTSSAPTLMKSTTLQQTPYALKLTFTFVNN